VSVVPATLRALGVLGVVGGLLDPGCAQARRPAVEVAFAGEIAGAVQDQEIGRIAAAMPWARVVAAAMPHAHPEMPPTPIPATRVVAGEAAHVLGALQVRGADLAWQLANPAPAVASIGAPARIVVGSRADVVVLVDGVPAGEGRLRVAIRDAASGLEQGHAEVRRAAADPAGVVRVSVPWLATHEGATRLRVQASLDARSGITRSPPGDVTVDVQPATVEVAVLEARPTWSGRFARLALADVPGIRVRTEVRVAPGIAVRTTASKAVDRPDADPDVVLVSGVESLTSSDVARLETAVRDRGQAVVLVVDEAPGAGAWRRLWPEPTGSVRTQSRPLVGHVAGHAWKMREWLAVPVSTGATPLASLESGAAVVLGRSVGSGRVVLVAALDAWRYRADDDVAFAAGWRALVQRLGADVPPAVGTTAWISGFGRRRLVHVDVALRPDLVNAGDVAVTAGVGADAIPMRLRQVERGRWRGAFRASATEAAPLVVEARAGERLVGSTRAVVDVGAPALVASWQDVARHQAARGRQATGGAPLPEVIAAVHRTVRDAAPDRWYVTRTWWFAGLALVALGTEWILRRLAGNR
jgi:hypothetical protein